MLLQPVVPDDGKLTVGPIVLDLVHYQATVEGEPVELTAKEFELLAFLARHAGKTCTHQMVLRQVWGDSYGDEADYLRVYIYRLRKKLGEKGGPMLRTSPGIGYCLSGRPEKAGVTGSTFFSYRQGSRFTSCSRRRAQPERMADFLVVLGIVAFALAMLGLVMGLGPRMSAVQAILLVVSILVFIYLGVAMFKPEKF